MIEVNLIGPYLTRRNVVPHMVAKGLGRIVNRQHRLGGRQGIVVLSNVPVCETTQLRDEARTAHGPVSWKLCRDALNAPLTRP
jgi:hypothetical protein